ncbi:hypothetical protein FACS189454_05830 [Planctomycetales bacterium]|nr:hypothetical protein FACS189454_05830 [Planctomycetales bacterium]
MNEKYFLIYDLLFNLETQTPIWQYGGSHRGTPFGGWLLLAVDAGGLHDNNKQVMGFRLPHSDVLQSAKLPDNERLAVYPRMEIALKIDGSVQDGRAEIEKNFTKIIKDNGLVLKPDAKVTLNLKVSREKPEKTMYAAGRGFFPPMRGSSGTEITYTPSKASITIQQGEKILWEKTDTHGPPSNIPLNDLAKDSIQNIVNKHMSRFEYKQWFLGIKIPKKISNPDLTNGSLFTQDGIKPWELKKK